MITFSSTAQNKIIRATTQIDTENRALGVTPYYPSPHTKENGLDTSYASVSEQSLLITPDIEESKKTLRQEGQIKKFNDRIKSQAEMTRAMAMRVEQLEQVGQQSLNLNAINQKAVI